MLYRKRVVKSSVTASSSTQIYNGHFTDITIISTMFVVVLMYLFSTLALEKNSIQTIQRANKENLECLELRNTERCNSVYF